MLRLAALCAIATSLLVPGLVLAQTQPNWQNWSQQNPTYPSGGPAPDPVKGSAPVSQTGILVYGRTSCGITTRMMQDLKARKIPYQFKNIDTPTARQEIYQLLIQGNLKVNSIPLPVVYVNGKVLLRPSVEQVLAQQ